MEEELNQTVHDEDHDTRPQHPVSGGRNPALTTNVSHAAEADDTLPLAFTAGNADTFTVVDQEGANDTPCDNGTTEPGNGGVETNQNAGAEEGRGQLDVPTPVLNVESPVFIATPDVDPGEDVPVVQDTIGILGNDNVDKGTNEGVAKSLDLAHGISSAAAQSVHGSDGHGSGSRCREDQVQLASDIDDEKLSERDGGEETKEGAHHGDGQNTGEIILGVVG